MFHWIGIRKCAACKEQAAHILHSDGYKTCRECGKRSRGKLNRRRDTCVLAPAPAETGGKPPSDG